MNKVCPECGSEWFTQRRTAVVEVTLYCDPDHSWSEVEEEIVDTDGLGDSDIVCDDCGEVMDDDTPVTQDEYDRAYDCDCGCGDIDGGKGPGYDELSEDGA